MKEDSRLWQQLEETDRKREKRIMSYFINATIELMEKEGIENLTIRKVAEQAKYNSANAVSLFL